MKHIIKSKKMKSFTATASHLCFRICHEKVHENYDGLKVSGTHQLVDDTNILVKKIP